VWQRRQQQIVSAGLLRHLKWLDLLVDILWLYQVSGFRWLIQKSRLLRLFSEAVSDAELLLPALPPPRIRQRLREQTPPTEHEQRRVGFLAGCVMRSVFAQTNAATVRVLTRNNCRVVMPREVGCCGALHAHQGDLATARLLAQHNIRVFEHYDLDAVVVNSAGCGAMLKEYGQLLEHDGLYTQRASSFSGRVKDISEFLAALTLNRQMAQLPLCVAYDDPCHLLHGQGISREPRQLLQQIPGVTLVPVKEADWCCGSAGTYNLTQPDMSKRLLDRKMQHIAAIDPDVIATGNPGCLLQLGCGVKRAGLRAEVLHPIELLDRAYTLGAAS
jgi:glycolate oxidase iron-sulfur subunit